MRDSVIVNRDPVLRDQRDRTGKEDPFGFFHDTSLQDFGRIAFPDFYSLLQKNGTVVEILVDKVYGCPGHLGTSLQDLFVDM